MELTRKQIILIAAVSGAILLLTVAAILIFTPGDQDQLPGPTASPSVTVSPTSTPEPTVSPSPTVFRLPLVPQWDTPQPGSDPVGAGAFAPQTLLPEGTAGPLVDAGEEHPRDILAVGLREGRAAALLLLRLGGNGLTLVALPTDERSLLGDGPKEQGAGAASLAEELTGRQYGDFLALDLACLPAVLEVTGSLEEQGADAGSALDTLALATAAADYMQRVSLRKLPALKRAVGDSFASNLSVWELWKLFWALRDGAPVRTEPGMPKIF